MANTANRDWHVDQVRRKFGVYLWIVTFKNLLNLDANYIEPPQRGDSALFEAANHGRAAAAQFLLQADARPDIPVDDSPADIAAEMGELDILRLFTEHTPILRTAQTPHLV